MKNSHHSPFNTRQEPEQPIRSVEPLHWALIILLTLYFLFCFLFLGARWFIATHIDDYRNDITSFISETAGVDIKASKVSVGFYYFWPTVTLENVEISRLGGPVSLTLPSIQGQLSWTSLWHLEPRFRHFSIHHPNLTVRRLSDELIDVAGFLIPVPADFSPETIEMAAAVPASKFDNRLTAWLFAQERLELLHGSVTYLDKEKELPIRISNANFVFEQGLFDWQAAVEGITHTGSIGREFKVRTAIKKDFFVRTEDPTSWSGRAYVKFEKTDVARLLKKFGFRNHVTSGTASTEIWFDFEKGSITHSTADLALSNVDLKLSKSIDPLRIQWLNTRLRYETETSDSVTRTLSVSDLDFLTDRNEHLGKTDIVTSLTTDASDEFSEGTLQASRLDLRPLVSIAQRLPIPEKYRLFFNEHPLDGLLSDVAIGFIGDPSEPANWFASSKFSRLSLPSGNDSIPAFSGLSGTIEPIQQTGGIRLALNSSNVRLKFPGVFRRETIRLDKLVSTLELNFTPQTTLIVHSLEASNKEAFITGGGSWTDTGGTGTLDLSGTIQRAKAEAIPYYLPRNLGEGLLDWLEAGILDGDLTNGVYNVRGPLNSFPWDDANKGKGTFRIAADLKRGKLDFLPNHEKAEDGYWDIESQYPLLRGIDARLVFEGNSMDIRGHSARSEGLLASDISVHIPSYVTDSRLLIDGRIQGKFEDALGYINSSNQLRRILSDAFYQSRGEGQADMRLKIDMPFSNPSKIKVDLDLDLANASLNYGYGLPFAKNINGKLLITEQSVHTPAPLTGETENGPLNINVRTEDGRINLMTQGTVSASDIERVLALKTAAPFFKQLSGTTPVLVNTAIGLKEPHFSITGTSDLAGITSHLPVPFQKHSEEIWPLSFSWIPNANGHDLNLHSFGRASMTLRFEKNDNKLLWTKGAIALGPQKKAPLGNDIDISLTAPALSLTEWMPVIQETVNLADQLPEADQNEKSLLERIGTVKLVTGELEWNKQIFPDIEATVQRFNRRDWQLRIGGNPLLSGSATYESKTDTHDDVLTVNFNHLHLPLPPKDQPTSAENEPTPFGSLPDMSISINDLVIGEMAVGKVFAHAQNRTESVRKYWDIHRLDIVNQGGSLSGKGVWSYDPGQEGNTSINLQLDIDDMGKVLSSLNVDDAMRGAPTHAGIQLRWQGTPFTPQLNTLNGSIKSESGSGSFLQIEPGAGRLLSLLSMQHLLHRLTLDFRDVLSQGFTFDSLYLTGTLENGIFTTPKATVFGSAATVVFGGKANLVQETLDAKAVILPSINAGGPTLALALVNPAVGIGTFLTQLLLQDQLSNIFRAEYEIKGSFDEPKLTKIDLTNKSAAKPSAAVQ